nr:phosphatase PAP2 family protein [Lachnospiraceae bacterium]
MTYFPWEMDLLQWFQGLHNPLLDKVMVVITSLGNAGIFWIVVTVAMLIFCKDKRVAWTSALALLFSLIVVNCGLKNIVGRDRPCWIDDSVSMLVKIPKDFSFPSGHSSASFA